MIARSRTELRSRSRSRSALPRVASTFQGVVKVGNSSCFLPSFPPATLASERPSGAGKCPALPRSEAKHAFGWYLIRLSPMTGKRQRAEEVDSREIHSLKVTWTNKNLGASMIVWGRAFIPDKRRALCPSCLTRCFGSCMLWALQGKSDKPAWTCCAQNVNSVAVNSGRAFIQVCDCTCFLIFSRSVSFHRKGIGEMSIMCVAMCGTSLAHFSGSSLAGLVSPTRGGNQAGRVL